MSEPDTDHLPQRDTRSRIIEAAAGLLDEGGRDAVTTRAVAAAAAVQAPAIYRLFGDKEGLLEAVAEYLLQRYVVDKAALEPDPDPVQDLRDGWNMQTQFNLLHPEVFAMMIADPGHPRQSPAAIAGTTILRQKIHRVALTGRLTVSEERAENLIRAAGFGAVLVMLGQPEDSRDDGLAVAAQQAVLAAIIQDEVKPRNSGFLAAAVTLKASLAEQDAWSAGEKALMGEWLDRVIGSDKESNR